MGSAGNPAPGKALPAELRPASRAAQHQTLGRRHTRSPRPLPRALWLHMGSGWAGKGKGASGKGAGTAAVSEDVLSSCRDPWTQEVSMGQDFAGCSSVFIWVGSGASQCMCLLGQTHPCRAGGVPWMSLPQGELTIRKWGSP